MAFDHEKKYNECSSIPHTDAMCRMNFDQDNDECNLFGNSSFNPNVLLVNFGYHNCIPFEQLRSESEREELAKRIIRRVFDGCPIFLSEGPICLTISSQERIGSPGRSANQRISRIWRSDECLTLVWHSKKGGSLIDRCLPLLDTETLFHRIMVLNVLFKDKIHSVVTILSKEK